MSAGVPVAAAAGSAAANAVANAAPVATVARSNAGLRLECPECGGRVFARASRHVIRHFYHQVRPADCELANESPEHHLLKLELAMAAREAGWRAELEVSGEGRDWRADVMVFDESGRPFMALEAQLSPMTQDEAQMRTDRYARDGVAVCWVAVQDRPWERFVPSLRVGIPSQRGDAWTVRHGLARYEWKPRTLKAKAKWVHISCPLGDAVKWVLEGRVHVHTAANGTVWWTARTYEDWALERARMEAEAEAVARAAEERRLKAAEQRRREAQLRALEQQRELSAELQRLAGFFERTGLNLPSGGTSPRWSAPGRGELSNGVSRAQLMATGCLSTHGPATEAANSGWPAWSAPISKRSERGRSG
ncbi:competence protein CoiA family protein [Streptomyces sp. NPDC007259]|uniref:competence protein CoiA n=1 Tax=Streptomyces sp. NPDC007259 TaxID=3154319 RepID=UPI0034565AC0